MDTPLVSEVIKSRRLELRLSLEDVAKNIGVNRSTVWRWEKGNVKGLNRAHLFLLSKTLYIPLEVLFGITEGVEVEDAKIVTRRLEIVDLLGRVKSLNDFDQIEKFIKTFVLNK